MSSLQWTVSASTHTSLATVAAPLSVSQLLRIERHRGFASFLERTHHKAAQCSSLTRHSSQHSVKRTAVAPFSVTRPTGCKPCVAKLQARPSPRLLNASNHLLHCHYFGTSHRNFQRKRAFSGAVPSLPTPRDPPRKPNSLPSLPNLSSPQHRQPPRKPSTSQDGTPPQGPLFRVRDEDKARTQFPKSGREIQAERLEIEADRRKRAKAKFEHEAAREREQEARYEQLERDLKAKFASITEKVADSSSTTKALAQNTRNFHRGVLDEVCEILRKRLDRLIGKAYDCGERTRELHNDLNDFIDRQRLNQLKRETLAFEAECDVLQKKKSTYWDRECKFGKSTIEVAGELWHFFNGLFIRSTEKTACEPPKDIYGRDPNAREKWLRPDGFTYRLHDLRLFGSSSLPTGGNNDVRDEAILGMFLLIRDLNDFERVLMEETHSWRSNYKARRLSRHQPAVFAYQIDKAKVETMVTDLIRASEKVSRHVWFHLDHIHERPIPDRTQYYSETYMNANAKRQRINDLVVFVSQPGAAWEKLVNDVLRWRAFRRADRGGHAAKQQALFATAFDNVVSHRAVVADHDHLERDCLRSEQGMSEHVRQSLTRIKHHCDKIAEEHRPLWSDFDTFLYYNRLYNERSTSRSQTIAAAWKRKTRQLKSSSEETAVEWDHQAPTFHRIDTASPTWQYTDFRGPDGKLVALDYCFNREAADAVSAALLGKSVLGIDLWTGQRFANLEEAVVTGNSARRAVPMLALASGERVTLFHLGAMETTRPLRAASDLDPTPILTRILESSSVLKVGEDINGIRDKLRRYFDVDLKAFVDAAESAGKRGGIGHSGQLTTMIRKQTGKSLPQVTHGMSLFRHPGSYLKWGNDLKGRQNHL